MAIMPTLPTLCIFEKLEWYVNDGYQFYLFQQVRRMLSDVSTVTEVYVIGSITTIPSLNTSGGTHSVLSLKASTTIPSLKTSGGTHSVLSLKASNFP